MKICYLDANLLVYYGNRNSPFHFRSRSIIKKLILENWQLRISSLILDEYEHAIIRLSGSIKAEVIKDLRGGLKKISKIPMLELVNPPLRIKEHFKILKFIEKFGLKPRDAYHLFIMKENKIQFMATFDNDFEKVFNKSVIKKFELALIGEK
ncbi:MAG: type II toxin-antitoxin system VapC family toxin [Candidatus Daviesbacteria bacterium]|nr:type II toxin-antitoxin system VapC family toxin [Candidatus Daviesbacteria bacterium]